jgi:maltooligosyltrehalose synthase
LLPVLGDQYGRALENREIRVIYADEELKVAFYETPLPLAPRTWTMILEPGTGGCQAPRQAGSRARTRGGTRKHHHGVEPSGGQHGNRRGADP